MVTLQGKSKSNRREQKRERSHRKGLYSRIDKEAVLSRIGFGVLYRTELAGYTQTGTEIVALCPFHNDKNPSFNANINNWLFNCHACGASGDIFEFIQRKHYLKFSESVEYLAEFAGIKSLKQEPIARKELPECPVTVKNLKNEYQYTDVAGEPLFSVFRFEADGHRKAMRQGHPRQWKDEKPVLRLPDGVARVPFNLSKYSLSDTIYVTEGENKAMELRKWWLIGTCNPGGAGKWRDEYSQHLKGKHVVLLPDNDTPGQKHMRKGCRAGVACGRKRQNHKIADLPHKGDIVDWRADGHTREEFLALVESTTSPSPKSRQKKVKMMMPCSG